MPTPKRQQKAATVDGAVNTVTVETSKPVEIQENFVGFPENKNPVDNSGDYFPKPAPDSSVSQLATRPEGGAVASNATGEISFNLEAIKQTVTFDSKPNAAQMEFYTGEMDVPMGAPNLSIDAMLADPTLNVSHAAAGARLGKLDILQNGLEVKIKETKVKRLAVELKTEEVKLAGDLAGLSGAQSDTKRKFQTAKHKKFKAEVQGKKEEFERIELVSDTVRTAARAQKSYTRARAYVLDNTLPGFENVGGNATNEGGQA